MPRVLFLTAVDGVERQGIGAIEMAPIRDILAEYDGLDGLAAARGLSLALNRRYGLTLLTKSRGGKDNHCQSNGQDECRAKERIVGRQRHANT